MSCFPYSDSPFLLSLSPPPIRFSDLIWNYVQKTLPQYCGFSGLQVHQCQAPSRPKGHMQEHPSRCEPRKSYLRERHGFPVCLQQLLQNGRILLDFEPLEAPSDIQLVLLSVCSTTQRIDAARELIDYAAMQGNVKATRFLLQAGACKALIDFCVRAALGLQGGWMDTALIVASRNGHAEVVSLLLEAGGEATVEKLIAAAGNGRTETARLLLKAGVDKDRQDGLRNTALIAASGNGHAETVRLLLSAGANVDLQDLFKNTALIAASRNGHAEVACLLLAAGADQNLRETMGQTAPPADFRRLSLVQVRRSQVSMLRGPSLYR